MKVLRGFAMSAVLLAGLMGGACDENHASSHDVLLGGVGHREGLRNPFSAGCSACHGNDLSGGIGPSCYGCHNNADHPVVYGGVRHNAGVDCTRCHGLNNEGGLGPACTSCHG